ncbi:hypothetical protein IWQ62_000560 [Dispira parvispora]|uniref:NADH dehydrogenase [ubiquinone] 1 beta subcomplex subunit 2 n=1 Tax=Dispira parvispora TaxID=1520584 RepID=A0A9W8AZX7_9FUNG|nr:hypothetical protein IWQ62_000560 [Dispira parvispora]
MSGPFVPPKVPAFQRYSAKFLGGTMFFFLMYRWREDGLHTLGIRKAWDEPSHHDAGHDKHH